MDPEEQTHVEDGLANRLILVLAFPDRTELIEWTDPDGMEILREAHKRSGRAMGLIRFGPNGAFTTEVLAPYSQRAAGRYLERIARQITAGAGGASAGSI